jgi:NAD(P)-dependent dehydrogenase (short-subunit alcohol dehydrogenase family)
VLVRGDLRDPGALQRGDRCKAVEAFGRIDVLVSNAAYQASFDRFEDITAEEWRKTFETNVDAFFYLVKAALPHMGEGASIIGTSSINADQPSPDLLPYATTKGHDPRLRRRTRPDAGRPRNPGQRGRAGADMDAAHPVDNAAGEGRELSGRTRPIGRAGQPRELAPAYVFLASDEASYRHRCDDPGHRRPALHLNASCLDAMKHQFDHENASLFRHG